MKQYQKMILFLLVVFLLLGIGRYIISILQQNREVGPQLIIQESKQQAAQDKVEAEEVEQPSQNEPSVGDVGENPPEYTQEWQIFSSREGHFEFKFPDSHETVIDNYGWPNSVVHLANKAGGQSYDITFEVWDDEKQAADEGRMADPNAFFGMVENPFTENFVSITCWNEGTKQDCEDIYATLVMQE